MASSNYTSSQPSTGITSSTTATFTSTLTTDTDVKSEEFSGVETTIPTDLTISPISDHARGGPKGISKHLLERKQLLHDVQLLKIELSQKNLIIDNLKADFMSRTEEMEEKLAEAVHARQMTQTMLEAKLNIREDDYLQKFEEKKLEITRLTMTLKKLEETNAKLVDKSENDRRRLYNIELSKEEYLNLQNKDPKLLSLREYVGLKVYELMWPYKSELETLESKTTDLKDANDRCRSENQQLTELLDNERKRASRYQLRNNEMENELKQIQAQLKTEEYKVKNFDHIKTERDKFMEDVYEMNRKASVLEATNAAFNKENDSLKSENSTLQQKVTYFQQDNSFANKRLQDVSSQNKVLEDQISKLNLQLDKLAAAREDIYEKYVNSRDIYKSQFERKLKEELDQIQSKTMSEIELLRRTSRDIYEQEIKSLKSAHEVAISEKIAAESALKQTLDKCERYLEEIHILKGGGDSELLNSRNLLLVKGCELEQMKLVLSDTQRRFKECQLENDKLVKKVDVYESEYKRLDVESGKKMNELEARLALANTKLNSYEKLERDLDDAVMDAAEASADDDGRAVTMFSENAGISTSIRRRLQHSFQLAKRILVLEKLNHQLKQENDMDKQAVIDLNEEVERCNRLLNDVDKPNAYLIDGIRSRDKLIKEHRQEILILENELQQMKKEREQLDQRIQLLTVDIENLLKSRDEITKMKKLLASFFPQLAVNRNEPQPKYSPAIQKKILPKSKSSPAKVPFR